MRVKTKSQTGGFSNICCVCDSVMWLMSFWVPICRCTREVLLGPILLPAMIRKEPFVWSKTLSHVYAPRTIRGHHRWREWETKEPAKMGHHQWSWVLCVVRSWEMVLCLHTVEQGKTEKKNSHHTHIHPLKKKKFYCKPTKEKKKKHTLCFLCLISLFLS